MSNARLLLVSSILTLAPWAQLSAAKIKIGPPQLPAATVNVAYTVTLSATGGASPYTWTLAAGQLPAGLSLSASGTIAGTPTAAGTLHFTLRASDSSKWIALQSYALLVKPAPAPVSVTTASLPPGTVTAAYNATLAAKGGTPPYAWGVTAGQLPPGLLLSVSGTLSGRPTSPGLDSFTAQVTDSSTQRAAKSLTVSVAPALSITTASLPDGKVGVSYSATLGASGGTSPYAWSVISGQLPAGLTLGTAGTLSGTPTVSGSSSFTLQVTDAAGQTASRTLTISITAGLSITTTSLPNGMVGAAYSAVLAASGGTSPYTWSIISGQLPAGLTLAASSGVVSGIPTTAGSVGFTIRAADSGGPSASQTYTVSIASGSTLGILTNNLQIGYIGQAYNAVLSKSGGVAPCTWSISAGQLPPGLLLSSDSGNLTGTPTQGGQFSATFTVRDSGGATASKGFNIQVFEQLTDKYGGLANWPCPGGAQPHFYAQRIGSRWHLCTPLGNAFWINGVYHVYAGDTTADYQNIVQSNVISSKYASGMASDPTLNWDLQTVRRLKSWAFTTVGEYAYTGVWPTHTDWQWAGITPDQTNPEKMPFLAIITPGLYAMRNTNGYAHGAIKDIIYGIKSDVYDDYRAPLPDFYDANFAEWMAGQLQNDSVIRQAWTGPNNDYFIGFTVDESDDMWGFGAGPDFPTTVNGRISSGYDQPHIGWMVLVTASNQSSNPSKGVTYSDTVVYSKWELSQWLSSRYGGNIAALNAAWGSQYSTFGSSGAGFGVGTGILDEDGHCPSKTSGCWIPTDCKRLTGATEQMKQDLDDFLLHFAQNYFSTVRSVLSVQVPGFLYLGTLTGGWGTPPRRQILQAMAQYADVLQVVQIPPNCSDCADAQQRIDFVGQYGGDKPWLQWDGYQAKADSYVSPYANQGQVDQLQTQTERGQLYLERMQQYLNARDTGTATYHNVGFQWWELYDNRAEQSNWGLITRRDNPYDGVSATTTPGVDSWGYPSGCLPSFGCETGSYGDFLSAVISANLNVLRSIASGQ